MAKKRTDLEVWQTYLSKEESAKVEKRMKRRKFIKRSQYLRQLIRDDAGIEGEEISAGRPRKEEDAK